MDDDGQPTGEVIDKRRRSDYISPVPKPKKRRSKEVDPDQASMDFQSPAEQISTGDQAYDTTSVINQIRSSVDAWRQLPSPADWGVTPETARLLSWWRGDHFEGIRPFFCQREAVETAIWLAEVAPKMGKQTRAVLDHLDNANKGSGTDLYRIALKLATGAGKTTVMAMLIAWQTVNAVRRPNSKLFTRAFLLVAPGITIRDRLRVLQPNDPDSYYATREIVPQDMLADLQKAKIIITNYHAFKLREKLSVSKGTRALLKGRGEGIETLETEGEMVQRVCGELMGMSRVVVLNDEAHHCYREKPGESDEEKLKGDDRKEADKNKYAARLWISGIEMLNRVLGGRSPGVLRVYDLSATPFFLSGSGYVEGTLFHWTASDFSLMDAIECGIVKLPRIPVADNIAGEDVPVFRDLWTHIGKEMPKTGGRGKELDPLSIPTKLKTALDALYGHYEKTYDLWEKAGLDVPPVFIVVCNNTTTSKLVFDYITGFRRKGEDGAFGPHNDGRLELFRNFDEHGNALPRPRTLLIDSHQLESGDALDKKFKDMAAPEIERFRYELKQRGKHAEAERITDQDLLREVMNTVGRKDRLGESIRCVVSVSMLTEGWDCNNVTHILGVRAFGTQLLCEQVVGRALRRQSYEINEENRFNVEYADILGIPFNFTAKPVVAPPNPPRETINVKAVRPERDHLEVSFPRVTGYRVEPPNTRLQATFNDDSTLKLTPDLVGPSITENAGIIGEGVNLTVEHLKDARKSTLIYELTKHLLYEKYRDPGDDPKMFLFGQLKRIVRYWLDHHLDCQGGTYPAQVGYRAIADMACERIKAAITEAHREDNPVKAVIDAYNPTGSTRFVNFNTSKETRWKTHPERCHVNWVICDSEWEAEFCRVAEQHPKVIRYVKNHNLGLEVPYLIRSQPKIYRPDFILLIDDGNGPDDLLRLIVEIKGFRGENVKDKHNTMQAYWIPGVNNLGKYGRWAFAEFNDMYEIQDRFAELIEAACEQEELANVTN